MTDEARSERELAREWRVFKGYMSFRVSFTPKVDIDQMLADYASSRDELIRTLTEARDEEREAHRKIGEILGDTDDGTSVGCAREAAKLIQELVEALEATGYGKCPFNCIDPLCEKVKALLARAKGMKP